MKSPFPWFGGKSKVSDVVWKAFGDVPNYVEPFYGSGAVLLNRPHVPKYETVNDLDCYLANFWRALQADPAGVHDVAMEPINEAQLAARHAWLLRQDVFREKMLSDPDYFDVKVAGWWVWGKCQWIGSGWCNAAKALRPPRQLPLLSKFDGIHGMRADVLSWFHCLRDRMSRTRVACGDWTRVLSYSCTDRLGITGVFLDPPYAEGEVDYGVTSDGVGKSAAAWAIANGDNPKLRIALCGYTGHYEMPSGWRAHYWKSQGGRAITREAKNNSSREVVYFSPYCLQ